MAASPSDVDGDALSFQWALTATPVGSLATLSDPTAVQPTFVVDLPGTYTVQLIVDDGIVQSAPASVLISTQNSPPVAQAGAHQTILVGTTVTLDGSTSSDVDDDPLTFRWALTATPVGSLAMLSDPTAVQPTFVADLPGTYVGQLIVNDGQVDSTPATTTITAEATTPPPPINQASLTVGPLTNGQVTITGAPGSVAGGAQVTITNTRTGQMVTVTATADGRFTATIAAQSGDTLSFIMTDAAGRVSAPTTVTVGSLMAPPLDRTVSAGRGSRIGYVDANGNLRVKEATSSDWMTLASQVADVQLAPDRIAVLKSDRTLWLGEQELTNPLTKVDDRVAAFQLTANLLGILREDGTYLVKEGASEPRVAAYGVKAFHLLKLMMAILGFDGTLWLQYGGGIEGFHKIAAGVGRFQLEEEWLAYTQDGRLMLGYIWDGFNFKEVAQNVADFEMEVAGNFDPAYPTRVHLAVLDGAGTVQWGTGDTPQLSLSAVAAPMTRRIAWSAGRLALHGVDGRLRVTGLASAQALRPLQELGRVEAFRLGAEGTLLVLPPEAETRGSLLLMEAPATPYPPTQAGDIIPSGDFDPSRAEQLTTNLRGIGGPPVFGLSSRVPAFTKRPVANSTERGIPVTLPPEPEDAALPGAGGRPVIRRVWVTQAMVEEAKATPSRQGQWVMRQPMQHPMPARIRPITTAS
jgi:hypothetical protein